MSATSLHTNSGIPAQAKINRYFDAESLYWQDVYSSPCVQGEIYRDRATAVLHWIDALTPRPSACVLEIGCGVGFLSVAFAQRGYTVNAIDASPAMVELARRRAGESGFDAQIAVSEGNVNALTFDDGTFDLVVAIGVIPWLDLPALAMREMARVLRPGGYVIVTADNRARLNHILDPRLNPMIRPLKRRVRDLIESLGIYHVARSEVRAAFHSRRFVDEALAAAGLTKARQRTIGFGPFTLVGRIVVPEPLGIMVHRRLQRLADCGIPVLRSAGAHYLVLCSRQSSL